MLETKTANNPLQSSPVSLQHRINHYELILQSAGEGIVGVDCDGDINFINPAALNLLDWREDEMFGRSFHEVLFRSANNDCYDLETCPVNFVLGGGEVMHVNSETFFRQNGTNFLVEYVCLPIKENERTTGAVITFQDITERRDLEEAATRAQKAALEATRLKSAFLANVSHEVRTPLNGVLGMTSLLLETTLTPEQKHYAEMIRHSAHALLKVVNDVLDFSKAEAGKVQLETSDFNLCEVINRTIELFSLESNRKNLLLTSKIDKNVSCSVRGDAGRLQQILNNLIGNALKFTERGGVNLHIEKVEETEQKNVLRFEIRDTGIGIASNIQETLFEPFTQADISTTRRFGGTGLGLAICRQLLELMGGEIGIQSAPQQGTTFWFIVPFEQPESNVEVDETLKAEFLTVETNVSNDADSIYHDATFDKQDVKILVVEDNIVNQKVAVGMLKLLGYDTDVAENGREALEAIENTRYDVILMDCQMPLLDGYEATKEIRRIENDEQRNVIIAMTANALQSEAEKCRAVGMDDYLCKPFKKNELAQILEKYLASSDEKLKLDEGEDFVQHNLGGILEANALRGLLEIEAREPDFLREMLTLYVSQARKQFELMREANQNKDLSMLRRAAHSLKGSSGNIGLMSAHKICTYIEHQIETSNWSLIPYLIAKLQKVVQQIEKSSQNLNNKTSLKQQNERASPDAVS